MKKGNYVLGIFLILVLFTIVIPLIPQENLGLTAKADPANWWDTNWFYRKKLTLDTDAGAGAISDYHINITIYRSVGTDADFKVYVGSKCEADYDDIRFIDWDNSTVLDYYIQSSDSSSAIVWVECDSPTGAGTETLWFYYGYSGASAYSNGDNTFLLFDDFDDGVLDTDKWSNGTGATWGGIVYEEGGSAILNMTTKRTTLFSHTSFSSDVALVCRTWFKDIRTVGLWINTTNGAPDGTKDCAFFKTETSDGFQVENNGVGGTTASALVEQDWQVMEVRWDTGTHARAVVDGTIRVTDVADIPDGTPDMKPFFYIYNGDASEYLKIGWAFVRKYTVLNDPDMSWDTEELRERPPTIDPNLTFACDSDRGSQQIGAYTNNKPTAKTVVQDLDGFTELSVVKFSLYDTGRSTEHWRVIYNETTDAVTEDSDASNMIVITSSGSTVINSTTRTIWFIWYPTHNHAESNDFDIKIFAEDDYGNNDTNWIEKTYEGGGQFEIQVDPEFTSTVFNFNDLSGTTNRGNINSALRASYSVTHRDFTDSWDTSLIDMWINATYDTWEIDAPTYSAMTSQDGLISANGSVGLYTYYLVITTEGAGANGDNALYTDFSSTYIADTVSLSLTFPTVTHYALGLNASGVYGSGVYDYNSEAFDGSLTWNNLVFTYSTATSYFYNVTAISGDTHGVTEFSGGTGETLYWENTSYVWSDIWTKYTEEQYYNHITISNLVWTGSSVSVQNGATATLLRNGTTMATTTTSSSMAQFVIGFTSGWEFANYSVKIYYVTGSYNITTQVFIKSKRVSVPTMNTLYRDNWDTDWTDLYLIITYDTNWHNATLSIWWNTTTLLDHFAHEGSCQITLPTSPGLYMFDILLNGTGPGYENNGSYPTDKGWIWLHYNYTVSLTSTTMHFAYYMNDGSPLLFHAFKTYVNGYRLPPEKPWYTTTASTVNLTITDVWNSTVYQDLTLSVSEYVDIVTTSYWLIFTNQRDYSVNVTINFNSRNWTIPVPLGPGEGFARVLYTGNYTIYCWRTETGEMEEGFPKSQSVSTTWEVFTEKTDPSVPSGGGDPWAEFWFMINTLLRSIGVMVFLGAVGTLAFWKLVLPRLQGSTSEYS